MRKHQLIKLWYKNIAELRDYHVVAFIVGWIIKYAQIYTLWARVECN